MVRLTYTFLVLFLFASCDKDENNNDTPREINYTFTTGTEGWAAFFSDYPVGSEEQFQLTFQLANLPAPLDVNTNAIMISGNNHSDDLLSFIVRKIDSLQPNKQYNLTFDVDLASNTPSNSVGIGGSPDLAFGVGAVSVAPLNTPDSDNWYRPNFNSELQSRLSNDTIQMVGTIGVGEDATEYLLINRNNKNSPLRVTTNNKGEIWVMMGIDSGFEGTTTLYYKSIRIKLE